MRDMSEQHEELKRRGVEVYAVNIWEEKSEAQRFIRTSDLDYHWLRGDQSVVDAFGIRVIPTQVLIDRSGTVIWTSGSRQRLDAFLEGVTPPSTL